MTTFLQGRNLIFQVNGCCPGVDPRKLVDTMWEITGEQTGESYARRLDPAAPLAEQVAASIVWSSRCMGETARVESGARPGEALIRHDACPWHVWHEKRGLLAEDRPGCDAWFEATLRTINEKLGVKLRFETLSALPDGGDCCLRRIWQES